MITWEYRLSKPHCRLPVTRMVSLFPAILALLSLCLSLNPAMLHLLIELTEITQVEKDYNYFKKTSVKTRRDWRKHLGIWLLERRMAEDCSFWLHSVSQQNLTFTVSRTYMVVFLPSFYLSFVNIFISFLFGCYEYFTLCSYLKLINIYLLLPHSFLLFSST